jgi:uncharacterized protein (TIGR02996 family)
MARFELGDELIEAWLEGDTLMTRRGRGGAAAPRPVARFVGRNEVRPAWEYEDEAQLAEDAARTSYVRFQSECLRGGWRRVRDPDREADVGGEPREPALDRALRADPDDDATRSVYADWLEQRGHPRGALIALQQRERLIALQQRDQLIAHQQRGTPRGPLVALQERAALATAAARLLEREAAALLGPLAGARDLELEWDRGFLRAARIEGGFATGDAEQLLWELLRHPSTRLLRELTIRPGWYRSDYRLMLDLLLLHASPGPPLSLLALGNGPHDAVGDLRGLDEAYPDLEELELWSDNQLELGDLRLPRLRRLAIRTVNLRLPTLTTVIDGTWPELGELELWFGAQSECTLGDLELLLDGTVQLPRLRVLRLRGVRFADELCERLVRSWHAPTLELLDLSDSALTDRGAARLAASREIFERLRRVDVERCQISERARAGLYVFR